MTVGRFGGGPGEQLLLAGASQFVVLPLEGRSPVLRQVAGFETELKDASYGAIAVGDVNADGVPEIAAIDLRKHAIELLAFDQQANLVSASRFKVFESSPNDDDDSGPGGSSTEPRDVVLEDVTGDGLTDIVVLVHDRLIIYPQDG